MVNVGILGCGTITKKRHAPEYGMNKNSNIKGFFAASEKSRAEALAFEFGGRVYDTWQEMIEDKEIDAVSVCTSNTLHAPITIAALNAGKHVLCEKPIAASVAEAERMVEAARKSGKHLMIAHNMRYQPAHLKAKEILKEGLLGKIITFRTTLGHAGPEGWSVDKSNGTWFFKKGSAAFGALGDLGIHKIDLLRWLINDEISEVSAFVNTLDKKSENGNPIDVDDNVVCLIKSRNGIVGTLTASWTYYGESEISTVIYCTNGTLRLYDRPNQELIVEYRNGKREAINNWSSGDESGIDNSGVIDSFIDCIEKGIKPEISGEEGLAALRVVEACVEASRTGRVIRL